MAITRDAWRAQPVPASIEELALDQDSTFARMASSPDMVEMLRAGYVPEDDESVPFVFCEGDSVFIHRSWDGVFMFRFEIGMDGGVEKIVRIWVNNDPSQFRRAVRARGEASLLINVLEQLRIETHVATRNDMSKLLPMPDEREKIPFSMTISQQDYEMVKKGELPIQMEDKWFMYVEDEWLSIHRSWTGFCIFRVRFEAAGPDIVVAEAWANRNPDQYHRSAASNLPTHLMTAEAVTLADNVKGLINRSLVKYYRKQALILVNLTNPVAA